MIADSETAEQKTVLPPATSIDMGSDCAEAEATKNTLHDGRWWVLSGEMSAGYYCDDVISLSDAVMMIIILLAILP